MIENPIFLYVEDDKFSCQIMNMLIVRGMGYPQLTVFEDSMDFDERLAALDPPPNVILLDIHVHPLNGFEMLQVIRKQSHLNGVKVIAVTASVMVDEVSLLKKAGFDGAISKPIEQRVFKDALGRILAGEPVWLIK